MIFDKHVGHKYYIIDLNYYQSVHGNVWASVDITTCALIYQDKHFENLVAVNSNSKLKVL